MCVCVCVCVYALFYICGCFGVINEELCALDNGQATLYSQIVDIEEVGKTIIVTVYKFSHSLAIAHIKR